jgi:hypothetical protein
MIRFDGAAEGDERRFGRARYPHHVVALGRWVNPALGVLGALVLGYLIAGYLSITVDAGDESTFSSMTDLLKAACAAAVALTWAVFGTRLGMRRTSDRTPLANQQMPQAQLSARRAPPANHCEFRPASACTIRPASCRNIYGALIFRRRSMSWCDWPGSTPTRAKHCAGSNASQTAATAVSMT